MAKRAAIYTRVSSAMQEDNSSLSTQEASCRAFAAQHDLDVIAVYSDVHTRTELWERAQLSRLREAVRRREIDAVICHAIDRLSGDPVHLGVVLSEADHAGVEILFVTEPLDDSPEGSLIRFVRGYAAKVEHEKIRERTMRGRIARIDAGKPPVGARPPYGLRWADDVDPQTGKPAKLRLEENPDTSWVVRRIFEELARGSSSRQVALGLTRDGIPSPTGKPQWHASAITGMIRHPVYTGNVTAWRWKEEKIKGRGKVQSRRPESEQIAIPGAAPALVTTALADAAIHRVESNRQRSVRNTRNPEHFLLRGGFAKCGYCGSALSAYNGRGQTAYRCNTTARDRHGCPAFAISSTFLDETVWSEITERLLDKDLIASEIQRLREEDPTRADITSIIRRRKDLGRRTKNLMRDLSEEKRPALAALIRDEVARLLEEDHGLAEELAAREAEREQWQEAQDNLDEIQAWVTTVGENLHGLDYAGKRTALDALGAQVHVWAKDHEPRYEVQLCKITYTTIDACETP